MARPKTRGEVKSLNIKLDAVISDRLDQYSFKSGVTKTKIVEKALAEYIKVNESKKA